MLCKANKSAPGVCGKTFASEAVRKDLQGQLEGLEIRMSERSEFPYFPFSWLRRS